MAILNFDMKAFESALIEALDGNTHELKLLNDLFGNRDLSELNRSLIDWFNLDVFCGDDELCEKFGFSSIRCYEEDELPDFLSRSSSNQHVINQLFFDTAYNVNLGMYDGGFSIINTKEFAAILENAS